MSRQRWLRACVAGALGALMITTVGAFTTGKRGTKPGPVISVTPTSVTFANTLVGEFSYQVVTISNTGNAADYLTVAIPSEGTFFQTGGGTCNASVDPNDPNQRNYWIPAGFSCTFQWGFNPSKPGKQTGTGTMIFDNSPSIDLSFTGRGTKH